MNRKRLTIMLSAAAFLLLIPFIAMRYTSEVNWSINDFTVMGALLVSLSVAVELALSNAKSKTMKVISVSVVLVLFFIIWVELSVGIF